MLRKILGILIASSVLAGAAFVYAIFVQDDVDVVPSNTLSSASAIIIDISAQPTSAVWTIADADPGEISNACFTLTNNDGAITALVTMTSSHTNTVLADEVVVALTPTGSGGTFLNADGTATSSFPAVLAPFYGPASLTGLALGGPAFTLPGGAIQLYCLSLVIPDTIADFGAISSQTNTTTLTFDSTLAP